MDKIIVAVPANIAILSKIKGITTIVPEILFRPGTNSLMVSFQGQIPTEEETKRIEEAMQEFGNVLPNHYRECSFVSFRIDCNP